MTMLLPRRIESSSMLPNTVSATVNRAALSAGLFMGDTNIGSLTSGNYQDYEVLLEPGVYTLTTIYIKYSSYGIIDAQLDGVSLGTVDSYSGSASYNNIWTISGINITTTGAKTLRYTSTTKNASGSAYGVDLQYWSLQRTDKGAELGRLAYASKHIDICPWVSWDANSGSPVRTQVSNCLGGGYVYSPNTINSFLSYNIALGVGAYTFTFIYYGRTNEGIADIQLGGVSIGTLNKNDGSGGTNNKVATISGVNITSDGIYDLKLLMSSTSGGSYYGTWHWITVQKTA